MQWENWIYQIHKIISDFMRGNDSTDCGLTQEGHFVPLKLHTAATQPL